MSDMQTDFRVIDGERREVREPKGSGPPVRSTIGFTAADLDQIKFPPINWIVPEILPEGFTILAGRVKLGKSWLALDWGAGIAYGAYTMGHIACQKGAVLHLALEDNPRRLQRRQNMLLGPIPKPELLEFNVEWPRLDQGGLEELEAWIETAESPRLITIDVLKMLRPPQGKNEALYDYDYRTAEPLRKLAGRHGLAILGIHHLNKRYEGDDPFDLVSGSNGLAACADATMILNRDGHGTTLYGRGRDIEEFSKALQFDKTTGQWTILGDAEDARRSAERKAILKVLEEASEPLSPTAIASAAKMKRGNVDYLLSRMAADGEVLKPIRGLYTPAKNPKKR